MKARDAALHALDAKTDALSVDAGAADELFAVVDLLESEAPLRRSLADPSASPEDRDALATRLFSSRISPGAMEVLSAVARAPFSGGRGLLNSLESQGVRALLRQARSSGDLEQVQKDLHGFSVVVDGNADLSDSLRNRTIPLEARRALVARLTADRVHPVSARLLARAAAARVRTLPLTVASYLDVAARLSAQQIAKVTVARPLDAERTERLRRALEATVGGPISLQVEIDPAVLGGMDVQLGDHIIESTIAGRLDDARRLLTTH
ncbi:F0F1 ATP synthase subunit delta [Tessaracoccus antarcticus]|uniref:ATP synthase subunit delta n=1 Tax=Tessaracoccus antarcticus TaxID=2479848 RepID=A0A3M0G1I6_9ACTN|nr:F0F1 ATP synthase subunit delta [Tessaracoccus antarcticus]RMB58840.1 F0F1 ATP synthase subunit delta [Tessaracoccus antarcticus]